MNMEGLFIGMAIGTRIYVVGRSKEEEQGNL
jgi:hypothetical protein